jgi:hypothetical protein
MPTVMVAISTKGDVAVLDPRTGTRQRTLVTGASAVHVALSPDRSTVWYDSDAASTVSAVKHRIFSVPVTGGKPTLLTDGELPAPSADGAKLAYVVATNQPDSPQVVVRQLRTGTTQSFPLAPNRVGDRKAHAIQRLSWSPDGTTLAVSVAEDISNDWSVNLLRPGQDRYYLGGGTRQVPATYWSGPAPGQGTKVPTVLSEGDYLPDGRMVVVSACCMDSKPPAQGWDGNQMHLQVVQPATGTEVRRVAMTKFDSYTSLAPDPSGMWLAYEIENSIYTAADDGALHLLAKDYWSVDW